MNKKILSIWKDPFVAGMLAGVVSIFIYNFISSVIKDTSFINSIKDFWSFRVPLWIYLIAAVIVFAVYRARKGRRFIYDEETLRLDKDFFKGLRREFLPSDLVQWARNHDFGMGFNSDSLLALGKVQEENQRPDFEFINPQLEKCKQKLIYEIGEFLETISKYCFSNNKHLLSVPPEWEYEQTERFEEAFIVINKRIKQVCNRYDELIRMGRRLLKVL